MNVWTGLHFFCFIIYIFSIFYVIIKNPQSAANWVLAMLFCYFAILSFCNAILYNTNTGLAAAAVVIKVQSIGWSSFISYYLLFILFLTNNKKLLAQPLLYVVIVLFPALFIYQTFNGQMLECCQDVPYGLTAIWKKTPWAYVYFAYYTVMFAAGSMLLFEFRNKTRLKVEKKMADILLASAIVMFVVGSATSVILKYAGLFIPVDVNVVFLIFTFGLIYCAEKLEGLTLTNAKTADKIMEFVKEGIVLVDNNGSLVTVNRAAMDIFGYNEKDGGEEALQFIEKEIRNAGVRKDAPEINNYELVFTDARGIDKTALISSSVISGNENGPGSVCTIRDITFLKKAENELLNTVKELKRSNEELESFAYVASHDMKEPLRMVTSYVDLIKKRFNDKIGGDGNDFIKFASEGAKRMSDIIEDLLEYSRVRSSRGGREKTETSYVVAKVVETLKFNIKDKNAIVEIKGTLPVISADAVQIEQVFRNLIGNALKFTGKEPPRITISAEEKGAFREFVIKDNGIGIDMQYSGKIFQIFQRLHGRSEYEGTGIGLAICRKIVENHGGRIWVESEGPGKGSTFRFTLPA